MIRFYAFTTDGDPRLGAEVAGQSHDITRGCVRDFGWRTLIDFLRQDRLDDLIAAVDSQELLLEEMPASFDWLPPVPRPGKIVAMIQNYRKHAAEFGNVAPPEPTWFAKLTTSLTGNEQVVQVPDWIDGRVDHEVELAVVIGRTVKDIEEDSALDAVAGYTILNDVSARRIQKQDRENKHPWLRCKNFDSFTPMGPYCVPSSYVDDPQNLRISCRVNDETRQDANTTDMIHSVRKTIAEMSRWMTLEPGDVLATGTPEGVYNLRGGDVCECEIENLGVLRNHVQRAPEK